MSSPTNKSLLRAFSKGETLRAFPMPNSTKTPAPKDAEMASACWFSRAISVRVRLYSGCSQMAAKSRDPSLS